MRLLCLVVVLPSAMSVVMTASFCYYLHSFRLDICSWQFRRRLSCMGGIWGRLVDSKVSAFSKVLYGSDLGATFETGGHAVRQEALANGG